MNGILLFGAQLVLVPICRQGGIFSLEHGPWAWMTAWLVDELCGVMVGWRSPIVRVAAGPVLKI